MREAYGMQQRLLFEKKPATYSHAACNYTNKGVLGDVVSICSHLESAFTCMVNCKKLTNNVLKLIILEKPHISLCTIKCKQLCQIVVLIYLMEIWEVLKPLHFHTNTK